MRRHFTRLSIGGKLQVINVLMITFVALVTTASLSTFMYRSQIEEHHRNADNLVRALADNLNSTLLFNDARSASATLRGLDQNPDVRYAMLYNAAGQLFASYRRADLNTSIQPSADRDGEPNQAQSFPDFHQVTFRLLDPADNVTPVGSLVVDQSLGRTYAQLWLQLAVLLTSILAAFGLLTLMLNRLQRQITQPLLALTDTMRQIRDTNNLNGRAQKTTEDEIGELAQGFNHLMTQLQLHDNDRSEATARLEAVLRTVPDLMFEVDRAGRYRNVWGARRDLLAAPVEELLGRLVEQVLPPMAAREVLSAIEDAESAVTGHCFGRQITLNLPHTGEHWFELSVARKQARPEQPATYIVLSRDITERRNAEEEIRQLAFYDVLTRLPNRRLLMDRLQTALAVSARTRNFGAVLFLDMDRFKNINDTLGHDHGDLLLIEVAKRIQSCLRDADTVARVGGDEFVVILDELDTDAKLAVRKAAQVSEKIRLSLSDPYQLNEHERYSSPSIGVCMYLGTEVAAQVLIKSADVAMYQAKDDGRNLVRFFDVAMQKTGEASGLPDAKLCNCVLDQ